MKFNQIIATEKGGPEVLVYQEEEKKPVQAGNVGINVEAAGVLLADVLWQMGISPIGPKPPFTPGYDLVGIIDQIGAGLSGFEKGQRVAAMIQYGGYTEYAEVPAEKIVLVPDGLDPIKAVAATTSYLTATYLINEEGMLEPGDILLVQGAGGGTGSAIVELANHLGIKVYGTASAIKHALVESKGGIAIDYKSQDFVKVLNAEEPGGVAMVIDPIGGNVTSRSLRLLKPGGRLVSTAMIQSMSGEGGLPVPIQMLRLPIWSLTHPGKKAYFWDVVNAANKDLSRYRSHLSKVFVLINEGKINPEIGEQLPLRDAAKAQQMLLDFKVQGKVVLVNTNKVLGE
jgi:NADPH:quinone reductase-like Zn-dependent oxidoreductase